MAQKHTFPGSIFLEKGRNWLSANNGRIEKAFRPCQNHACRQSHNFWDAWLRNDQGVHLQDHWYCCADCFESAAQSAFSRLLPPAADDAPKRRHRIPIGLLLLSRGAINDKQLKQALLLQRTEGGGKIGKILQEIHAISEKDVTEGLAAQWGCPTYPLANGREFMQCASLLPLILLEAGRMLPVHYLPAQGLLFIAFVNGVDRSALYAVEQMLHVRTEPCIVSESDLCFALESVRPYASQPAAVFESHSNPMEMARTTRSYAWQLGAEEVWAVRSGHVIWIRMNTRHGNRDILFQSTGTID